VWCSGGRVTIGGSGAVSASDFGQSAVTVARASAGVYNITLPFTPVKVLAVTGSMDDSADDLTLNPDSSAFTGATVVVNTNSSGTPTDPASGESFDVVIVVQRYTI